MTALGLGLFQMVLEPTKRCASGAPRCDAFAARQQTVKLTNDVEIVVIENKSADDISKE